MTVPRPTGIDPRGPRFGAALTAVLLLVTIFLALIDAVTAAVTLLGALALLFAWGAFAGIARHPWGAIYRLVVRPRLGAPEELEDPAPPTFAQGVGLVVTAIGFAIGLALPVAVPSAAALAFAAAFLNAVFGLCIGCQLYLGLVRVGLIRRRSAPVS